ncbi:MAG: tetratricopeptide repeat protein [Sphingomicrobium sp.]
MVFFALILALQVYFVVDVIRHGRSGIWIMALVMLPLASSIAYFIIEVYPRLHGNRHVRTARQKVIEKLDPERELRAARDALDVADTMANRLRVADALSALGRHPEALPLYRSGAGLRPDFRTGEKLARCLYLNDKPGDALAMLESLPKVTGQSDKDRAALLRARILEDLDRTDEALALYADVVQRMPGDEARCRYAALLLKLGRNGDARTVLEEVEHRHKRLDRHSRAADAPMYEWALKELQTLRA